MITGVHLLFNSEDAEADRAFLTDVLGWRSTEQRPAHDGWLIYKAPLAELGVHQHGDSTVDLHLMCDDIATTVADLRARGVKTGPVADVGYGFCTRIRLPSGAEIGLYEPRHATGLKP
jgi:predicted enzyme related to lactoylglutathione lyase